MADIISAADKAAIRIELRKVTDTFYKTPITYRRKIAVLSEMGDDGDDNTQYSVTSLLCMDEYPYNKDSYVDEEPQGDKVESHVRVTFNMDYLSEAPRNLVNPDGSCKFKVGADEFTLKGDTYSIVMMRYDGPLEERPILVYLYGRIKTPV